MQLKIKAEKLKEMVSRAVKGAGNNKLIPITSLMAVELKKNVLTLTTTDATNYLYINEEKVEGDDFYVVVPVEIFSKLIGKLTCDTVSLILSEKMNTLEVKGNGNYIIELPQDEEGGVIKYPNPLADFKAKGKKKEIHASTIASILTSVKPSLATSVEVPCYTGYYVGDSVIGTNSFMIALMDVKIADTPMLISQETMNLLAVMTSEKIDMKVNGDVMVFSSPDCVLYSTQMEDIESYPVDSIKQFADLGFDSYCKVSKSALLQVLDRLSLFVGTYDKNGINLTFTADGLQVSSKSSSGVEVLDYVENSNFKNYTCIVDIMQFVSQVKALAGDAVTLYYGDEHAIKMIEGNLTQVLALLVKE